LPFAAFDPSPAPFIALMALGFLIGTAGHVYRNQWVVGIGIALVFLSTLVLPLLLYLGDR
jgi:hypothetical protein